MSKKTINIKLVDFQQGLDKNKLFIYKWLVANYDVVESDNPDYLVFSVFGDEHLRYKNCIKIFVTGENQAPDFNFADYAIGFELLQFGDRYMCYPQWAYHDPKAVEMMLAKHMQPHPQKTEFCSFVYSNQNSSKERNEFFSLLSAYKKVNSGGRYMNNIGGKAVDDKLLFQSKHKFAIAFENASHLGYTTEKLIQAFAAHTVPIYWGNPAVNKVFNKKSFVNCADFSSFEQVVEFVKKIDNDDALYNSMLNSAALTPEGERYLNELYEQFDEFMRHIFEQPLDSARRFSRDYWTEKQRLLRLKQKTAYEKTLFARLRRFFNKHLYAKVKANPKLWNIAQQWQKKLKI